MAKDELPDLGRTYLSDPPYEYQLDMQTRRDLLGNPNYEKERKDIIEKLENHISDGSNVEYCEQQLKKVKATPSRPEFVKSSNISWNLLKPILRRFDPMEPPGLTDAVYRRIEELKIMLEQEVGELNETNIRAVLRTYRTGQLQVEPGKVSFWKGGVMKRGLGDDLHGEDLVCWIETWNKEGPPGTQWCEDPHIKDEMLDYAVYPPRNEHLQHEYEVTVRLKDSTTTKTFRVFDDTGSTYLTLSAPEDCADLQLNNQYQFYECVVSMRTANGLVARQRLLVEVKLRSPSGADVGDFVETLAVIHVGSHQGPRLSGMFVRRIFFTGTAPDGNGNLDVSRKKYGMTNCIPVV